MKFLMGFALGASSSPVWFVKWSLYPLHEEHWVSDIPQREVSTIVQDTQEHSNVFMWL